MPIYNLEFQTQIKALPQVVYDHLSDPHNFVGLQPLLTHVEAVQFGEQDGLKNVSYATVEAFRGMGVVLYHNRIQVKTTFTDPPLQFTTTVHSFPNITLHVEYTFELMDGGTLVKERMQIHVHSWLAGFVTSEATKAQTALLANLKKRLETM
jgi:hypothetical protein